MVLLGDAKATAHFSIGSGTKLAMEDAIALHAGGRGGRVRGPIVLARFEHGRREAVEKIQHAADVSLVWFEHVAAVLANASHTVRVRRDDAFEGDHLRRSGAAGARFRLGGGCAVRAGGGRQWANRAEATGPPMFQPFRLRGMRLANRVVVSPMCQYRRGGRAADGLAYGALRRPGDRWRGTDLYRNDLPLGRMPVSRRAARGCGTTHRRQPGARIVAFTHAHGAAKDVPPARPCRAERQHAADVGRRGPRHCSRADGRSYPPPPFRITRIAGAPRHGPDGYGSGRGTISDRRRERGGERCGFDMLELHCAPAICLASFLSPLTNTRIDEYGGTVENRLRFPLEVFDAFERSGRRRSRCRCDSPPPTGPTAEFPRADVVGDRAGAFAAHGCDLLDVSTGQTVADAAPVYGRMFQVPFSDMIRNETGLATMCVGSITSADQVNSDPRRRAGRSGRFGSAASGGSGFRYPGRLPITASPISRARCNTNTAGDALMRECSSRTGRI